MSLRRIIALLLAGLVAALALVVMPTPASAAEPDSRSLPLINYGSGKCFEPSEPSGHVEWAGVPIKQRTCQNTALDNWTFESVGFITFNGGEPPWWCIPLPTVSCDPIGQLGYHIKNQLTGLCLDARDGATTDGSVVQQWTCGSTSARSMLWWVEDGDYPSQINIMNFRSDLCLDVRAGSLADGAQLQQYHCTDENTAQNFYQNPF
jgi:hypothetical protein